MKAIDIYQLVNNTFQQATGIKDIEAVDSASLVSMGETLKNLPQGMVENFLNVLVDRIGKTVLDFRKYRNKMSDLVMDELRFGAIVQKLKVFMPEAEEDQTVLPEALEAGETSIDHYKINVPKAAQTFFTGEKKWQIHVTIQDWWLEEAFLSENQMGSFIQLIFGEVQNKIEKVFETLGRTVMGNYIASIADTDRHIHLLTMYNNFTGKNIATPDAAKMDNEFLRFAVGRIKVYSDDMTEMSTLFSNGERGERHTPFSDQRFKIIGDFNTFLETNVEYAAFNRDFVSLNGFESLSFWQSIKDKYTVEANVKDKGNVKVENVVAILYDRDALGMFKKRERVATTPVNAAGLYYNTYWHFKDMWFNDLSENFLIFSLD